MSTQLQPEVFEKLGRIALIGGGQMGEAIVAGLVQGALLSQEAIAIADPNEERRAYLEEAYGVRCVASGAELAGTETALLAVKPQVFKAVAGQLAAAEGFKPERVISIAAGITTATIKEFFPEAQVIRVMPNAPLMVSAGMSAVAVSAGTPVSEGELTVELFSLMGEAVLLDEELINAATALSGSGPAYFALFVEHLTEAGTNCGLKREVAQQLALQTLTGTAKQLNYTGMSPAQLRVAVTSPGGTTQAALESFEANKLNELVTHAVNAALTRAEELA